MACLHGQYIPDGNLDDGSHFYAYGVATLMQETLRNCGDVPTLRT
jgi:hypothetical protein